MEKRTGGGYTPRKYNEKPGGNSVAIFAPINIQYIAKLFKKIIVYFTVLFLSNFFSCISF